MNRRTGYAFAVAAVVWITATSAQAQMILVGSTSGVPGTGPQPTNRLVDIDLFNGTVSNSRDLGLTVMSGIATHPATGALFGLTTGPSNVSNSLFTINPFSGAVTAIGSTGLPFIIEGDIAFHPASGLLYGIQDVGTSGTQNNLFTINPVTGIGTVVGNTGSSGDLSSLCFSPNGTLYTIDSSGMQNSKLLTLDSITGQVVSSITMNVNLGSAVGMTFDPISGVAYLADNAPSPASGGTNSVYTIDVLTGVATLVGPTGDIHGISGIAFVTLPEPSSVMLAGIGCFAAYRWRSVI